MKRTASNPASPPASVHVNGSSVTRRPKRKWRPEVERDRSMRAYDQNPRALAFACNPCECGGSADCPSCNGNVKWSCHACLTWNATADDFCITCEAMRP